MEYTTFMVRRYDDLITSKADTEIDALVERSPSFDEYGQELRRYAAVLDDINYNTVKVIRIGMFEVRHGWSSQNQRRKVGVKFGRVVFETNKQTDRQTDIHHTTSLSSRGDECLSVCLFVCLENHTAELHQFSVRVACVPWLGPPVMVL